MYTYLVNQVWHHNDFPSNLVKCGHFPTELPQGKIKMEDMESQLRFAVTEQNLAAVEHILQQIPVDEKDRILNYISAKKEWWWRYKHDNSSLEETHPILFQSLFSGKEIFDHLRTHGADLLITDPHGWNLIHYLVAVSFKIPELAEDAVGIYKRLKGDISSDTLAYLLMQEDLEGLRPLEFSMHLGCLEMFEAIFDTEDVYLVKRERKGFYDFLEYDISEYESLGCDNRRHKSPMLLLASIDKRILSDQKAVQILVNGPLSDWVYKKLHCNVPFILIWACLRVLLVFCFYFVISVNIPWIELIEIVVYFVNHLDEFSHENETEYLDNITSVVNASVSNESCNLLDWYGGLQYPSGILTAFLYMLMYAIFALLYDITEGLVSIFHNWRRWRSALGKPKNLVASSTYYRVCQIMFSTLSIIWILFYILAPKDIITDIGLILVTFLSTWSVLYFVQIVPFIGKFVNSIQEMLAVMLQFIIVYVIILIPFPHAFQVLLRTESTCDTVKDFESFGMGSYSVFRIMLNMVDLTSYNSEGVYVAYILHVIFVFFVAILLVNFLIALMSSSVGQVVDAGEAIMMIQRLSVVMLVEWRLTRPFVCIYEFLHRIFFRVCHKQIYLRHKHITRGLKKSRN